jgi:REP element-mobilizing transposase RayT
MSRSRYRIFEEEYPYFLTNTVVAWLPVFAYPALVQVVLDSWRYLQREEQVSLYGYVIMENHLHWIAAASDLSRKIGRFKSYTARRIIEELERQGMETLLQEPRFFKLRHKVDQVHQLWQEGSHPERLQHPEMMLQKMEYMHNNPLRRGYVDEAVHWRYSSARDYAGRKGLIEVVTDWR